MSSTDPTAWFEIHVQDGPRARACRGAMPGAKPETPGAPCDGPAHGFISPAWIAVEAGREQVAGDSVMREKPAIGEYGHIARAIGITGNPFGRHALA